MPIRISIFILPLFVIYTQISAQTKPAKKIQLPNILEEVSGMYYVSPDSIWWHNDSGDAPKLYLTNDQGYLLAQVDIPAKHIDWEDITYDDEGWLYIADFGNNRNNRNDLVIYKFHPVSQQLDSIPFAYENQDNETLSFNAEGLFHYQDSLYLFTKDWLPDSKFETRQYVLSTKPGKQVAKLQDVQTLKKRVVTGAAIHHNSGIVGLVSYYYNPKKFLGVFPRSSASVFFLYDYPGNYFLRGKIRRKSISGLVATQYESIDFINDEFYYVASEKTAFIKANAKRKKWKNIIPSTNRSN